MEPKGYAQLLEGIKTRVREARVRAVAAVNRELVLLYWHIGREILKRKAEYGWGARVIERLSHDLGREFPEMRGLSLRNLKYMQAFAAEFNNESIVQTLSAQLSWSHNIALIDKVKDSLQREWYARQALTSGWSLRVLIHQIETGLYDRQGRAITNFDRTLPPERSELARALLNDPYPLGFLGLSADADERALEAGLVGRLQRFLLTLGRGFAFVGRQVRLEIGGDEFRMDLLFYHLRLHCYVVVELKSGAFRPEHAGKLNFYLAAVDDLIKQPEDQPSIGMILCREKNSLVVEYSLRAANKPIGVAAYTLTTEVPRDMRGVLPEPKDIVRALR